MMIEHQMFRTPSPPACVATRRRAANVSERFFDDEGTFRWNREFPDGTTGVEGLYIAGRSAGTDHQVVVGAGHGASVGLQIIKDEFKDRGFWPEIANYVDWIAYKGRYEGDDWYENVKDSFLDMVPDEADLSDREIRKVIEKKIQQVQDRQVPKKDARERDREAQMKLIEALDDDVVEEYVETHYLPSSVGDGS